MRRLFKDSGLDGLKGSVQYCADCGQPTVHYRASEGWPVCGSCGYNADVVAMAEDCDNSERVLRIPLWWGRRGDN